MARRETDQRILELNPTDKPSIHWEGSTYRGKVIARAPDERQACQMAASAFGIAVQHRTGRDSPESPWKRDDLVSCREIHDSGYETTGPNEVLFPRP